MTALLLQPLQAYHAAEDRELGRPVQVDASPADSAGPWTAFWSQTAPQLLRFKVGPRLQSGSTACCFERNCSWLLQSSAV